MDDMEKPGCLAVVLRALGLAPKFTAPDVLAYHMRDDFLSPVELNFFRVLRTAVSDWAVICPKVSLGDLFYAESGEHRTNVGLRNRIARKHVDFLLCDPQSMRPLVGIELDDASHQRPSRQERDRFVEQVFAAAGLPLLREPARVSYSPRQLSAALSQMIRWEQQDTPSPTSLEGTLPQEGAKATSSALDVVENPIDSSPGTLPSTDTLPLCPKCGRTMVLRTAKRDGPHKGRQFWGCPSYPRCHGRREYLPESEA
jgi:hypothetical protein